MRLQYASDLHLEFEANEKTLRDQPLVPSADILLLAGDITTFDRIEKYGWFFDQLSADFKAVYWVPGNHEYYHSEFTKHQGSFEIPIRDNVFLVNDYAVTVDQVRLLFSTLWTDISQRHAFAIQRGMNDFNLIRYNGDRLTADHLREEHKKSLAFLEYELLQETPGIEKVVVTHHVPTFLHYPPQFLGDALNEAFATELKQFIRDMNPAAWIYGHHHQNIPEFLIGETRLLTNQLGYVRYGENKLFDRAKILQI